jgi:hypothetical protein
MNGWTKEQVMPLTTGTSTNDAKIDGLADRVREAAANSGSVTDATWKAAQQAGWSDERLADAFAYLGAGPRCSDKKVRPDRRPDGRRNEQPTGGGQGCSYRVMPTAPAVQPQHWLYAPEGKPSISVRLSCGLEDSLPDQAEKVCDQEYRSDANLNCNQIHVFVSFC